MKKQILFTLTLIATQSILAMEEVKNPVDQQLAEIQARHHQQWLAQQNEEIQQAPEQATAEETPPQPYFASPEDREATKGGPASEVTKQSSAPAAAEPEAPAEQRAAMPRRPQYSDGWEETRTKHLLQYILDTNDGTSARTRVALRYLNGPGININANIKGSTLLSSCITKNDVAIFELLIKHGADVNMQVYDGMAPLNLISHQDSNSSHYVTMCKLLITHGAELETIDKYGNTALMRATQRNNTAMCKLLVDNGANTKIRSDGNNLLDWAYLTNKNVPLCRLLITHGAILTSANPLRDNTVLALAARCANQPLLKLLENSDARIAAQNNPRTLIEEACFSPIATNDELHESQERVLTILLCWYRTNAGIPKDIKRRILLSTPMLMRDTLNCPIGWCKDLAHLMPLQAVYSLVFIQPPTGNGVLTEQKAIEQLKKHKFEQLTPHLLCLAALAPAGNNNDTLLDPEALEANFGAAIAANIRKDLHDAKPSIFARAASKCSIQ